MEVAMISEVSFQEILTFTTGLLASISAAASAASEE
jgi:hypothetical protein